MFFGESWCSRFLKIERRVPTADPRRPQILSYIMFSSQTISCSRRILLRPRAARRASDKERCRGLSHVVSYPLSVYSRVTRAAFRKEFSRMGPNLSSPAGLRPGLDEIPPARFQRSSMGPQSSSDFLMTGQSATPFAYPAFSATRVAPPESLAGAARKVGGRRVRTQFAFIIILLLEILSWTSVLRYMCQRLQFL